MNHPSARIGIVTVCGRALVVNLPGRPKSIRECLDAVFPAIPSCVDLIHTGAENSPRLETKPERLVAFRAPDLTWRGQSRPGVRPTARGRPRGRNR